MSGSATLALGAYIMAAAFVIQDKQYSAFFSFAWLTLGSLMAYTVK